MLSKSEMSLIGKILTNFVLLNYGSAAINSPAAQQDDSQIQILTVGHSAAEEGETEAVMSCAQSQSKQDLRVTMLKKGKTSAVSKVFNYIHSNLVH